MALLLLLLFVISECLNFMYVYLLNIMLYTLPYACADPGIFVRGGGGVQVSLTKKSSDNFFFLVLSLFYRSQMVNFEEIYHF